MNEVRENVDNSNLFIEDIKDEEKKKKKEEVIEESTELEYFTD